MSSSILQIQEPVLFDESISNYELHTHNVYNTTTFDCGDEIRIAVQNSDNCLLPSKSFLRICGRLVKNTAAANTVPERTKFVNNGCCHLFREMRFLINNFLLDENKNCGITTLMKNYVSLTPAQNNVMLNASWNGISETESLTDENGYFDFSIPLSILFGCCSDYVRVFVGVKMELILIRANSDLNALITTGNVEDCKVVISKIEWNMPNICLNDRQKIKQLNLIASDKPIPLSFRSWSLYEYPMIPVTTKFVWTVKSSNSLERPRYVIIGLQTNRKNNAAANASQFDKCNVRDVKVFLNNLAYPYQNLNLDFAKSQYSVLYQMYADFQTSFLEKRGKPLLSKSEFINQMTLFVVDCSKQNENIKQSNVDLRIEIDAKENFPANTSAQCLIIHDTIIQYQPLSSLVRKL